ncbi:hypothetical protein [Variovorax gossypii]
MRTLSDASTEARNFFDPALLLYLRLAVPVCGPVLRLQRKPKEEAGASLSIGFPFPLAPYDEPVSPDCGCEQEQQDRGGIADSFRPTRFAGDEIRPDGTCRQKPCRYREHEASFEWMRLQTPVSPVLDESSDLGIGACKEHDVQACGKRDCYQQIAKSWGHAVLVGES